MDYGGTPAQDTSGGVSPGSFDSASLDSPKAMGKLLDTLKRQRTMMEADWRLNLAFYRGRQYSYYNRSTGRIDSLPTEDGDKPRYRVRLVSNQIAPGVISLVSKYTKSKPQFTATPGSGAFNEVKAAQMAEDLLDSWWTDFRLRDKVEDALVWSFIAGQGWWKITWDASAGTPMKFMVDPTGKPIVGNDALADLYRQQCEAGGLPVPEQTVYLGDIRVETMSPFDVYLDPTAKTYDECAFVICRHNLTPEQIRARWGVTVVPDAAPTSPETTLPFRNSDNATASMVKAVYIGYWRPTPSLPKGRYCAWVDTEKQFLEDAPWPFPFKDLPLVKIGSGKPVPGAPYDDPLVSDARPLQKELNRSLSQIVEFKNLTIRPQVWAPANSLVSRLTTEPGAVNYYNPVNGLKPELAELGNLPPYVFEHINGIVARLNDIFGLSEIDAGSVPPNIEAGIAIDLLQEMSADKFSPGILRMEESVGLAGRLMLALAQRYYKEPRLAKIGGSGSSVKVKQFTNADITGNIDIRVDTGSGLPRSRAGRQAAILRMVEMQILPPDKAWKYLDIADLKTLQMQMQADEDQAWREHDKLIGGQPIDPVAYQQAVQQAQQQVMQAMQQPQEQFPGDAANPGSQIPGDPGDLQPDPDEVMQNAQQAIQQALVAPKFVDNHQVHIDIHGQFVKSVEFESLELDVQSRFTDHIGAHYDILLQLPQPGQPVKTSLQIKTTTGPTVLAKILRNQGVMVSPDETAEPPLDTWVNDDTSKPDDPGAMTAMGELARQQAEQEQEQQMAQMQQEQQLQQMSQQQGAHEAKQAHAAADASRADAQAHQAMRHAEEMHQAKVGAVKQTAAATAKAKQQRPKGGK